MSDLEIAILRMFAGRMTDNEIAFALAITPEEVAVSIDKILRELAVDDREAAVEQALAQSLIEL